MSHMRWNRVILGVTGTGLAVALLGACAGSDTNSGATPVVADTVVPRHGGRIVVGIDADPNGLDPTRNAWDPSGLMLANALYDPLAAYDSSGRPQPYLAESWRHSPDYKTWWVKVRPGVKFHDGQPADAAAGKYFVDKLRASPFVGAAAKLIADSAVVDDLTVSLSLTAPWASFPNLLTGQGGYIVAPSQLDDPKGTEQPDGTGPFKLRSWKQNEYFELVRNDQYWRPALPYLDAVDFHVVADGTQRVRMLEQGDLDVTRVAWLSEVKALDDVVARQKRLDPTGATRNHLNVERDNGPNEVTTILFNTSKPPLNDLRVRRALAHAIDVPSMADRLGWPRDHLANGPLPLDSPFFAPATYPAYDPDRARSLLRDYLRDAKVPQVRFKLYGSNEAGLLQELVTQWGQVGVKVDVDNVDVKQRVRKAAIGDTEAVVFRYFGAVDPDVLWHFWVSDTITKDPVVLNFARLANREIDEGMNAARGSEDPVIRKAGYARVQQAFAQAVPYLWLVREDTVFASTSRVRDAHNVSLPDASGNPDPNLPAMPFVIGTTRLTETWVTD